MSVSTEPQYVIPVRYRKMENMHIIFWLLKDIAWCMFWQVMAVVMIAPTLIISIIIAYRTRKIKSELAHNLAISFWISANALWMISEFFHFDTAPVWGMFTGKHLALIPFTTGVLILAYYYLFQKPKEKEEDQVATL
ncbi:MAG TPA: hypothetical protein VGB71_08330 [Flavisolibacter sp.]